MAQAQYTSQGESTMKNVTADLNRRGPNNTVRVSLRRFAEPPKIGEKYVIVDGEDTFVGIVVEINPAKRVALVDIGLSDVSYHFNQEQSLKEGMTRLANVFITMIFGAVCGALGAQSIYVLIGGSVIASLATLVVGLVFLLPMRIRHEVYAYPEPVPHDLDTLRRSSASQQQSPSQSRPDSSQTTTGVPQSHRRKGKEEFWKDQSLTEQFWGYRPDAPPAPSYAQTMGTTTMEGTEDATKKPHFDTVDYTMIMRKGHQGVPAVPAFVDDSNDRADKEHPMHSNKPMYEDQTVGSESDPQEGSRPFSAADRNDDSAVIVSYEDNYVDLRKYPKPTDAPGNDDMVSGSGSTVVTGPVNPAESFHTVEGDPVADLSPLLEGAPEGDDTQQGQKNPGNPDRTYPPSEFLK
jgi:hypothetical protein